MARQMWRVLIHLKGAAGKITIPATPPTFEADSLQEAVERLNVSALPDNDLVKTIGITLELVEGDAEARLRP